MKLTLANVRALKKDASPLLLRSIAKGQPMIQEIIYHDRPCKVICVGDKTYGQFIR